jgi:hypothetical protein
VNARLIWAGAGGLMLALVLAGVMIWLFGNAREAAGRASGEARADARWQALVKEQSGLIADLRVANERKVTDATTRYITTRERLQPIIIQSLQEATDYAQTPAGAVQCLDADRVRGIEASAAALGL